MMRFQIKTNMCQLASSLLKGSIFFVLLEPAVITLTADLAIAENVVKTDKMKTVEMNAADSNSHDSALAPVVIKQSSWVLTSEKWEIARNGESILALAVLNDLIREWLSEINNLHKKTQADKSEIIEIHYPSGEEGELWVQELADWLVALGIPSRFMLLTAGSGVEDEIQFRLNRR